MLRSAVTKNGIVQGLPADDPRVTVYKGIPFAAPPVGELRWKAPQPCENWEGIRQCYKFGPICMQDRPGVSDDLYAREFHVDSGIDISEDSLYLNIWTPAKSTEEKLPVLVWIYGGAFQWGYTSELEFNGERLARHGVIVVSIAYRLGVFGFLAHPGLSAQDPKHPTNFGLLDQQAGIRWVYENIEAFGGDKGNITLAGQSAGGSSVCYNIVADDNAKMIKRIAILSGFIRNPFLFDNIISPRTIDDVEKNGKDFLETLGCASIEEARAIDAEKIVDVYNVFAKDHPRFVPCIDGAYVKEDPFMLFFDGKAPDVPILTGYTKDEFIDALPKNVDSNDDRVMADVFEKDGRRCFNIIQNSVRTLVRSHIEKGLTSPVYTYKFAPSVPGYDNPGAFHSCDLWFFFETVQKCWRPYSGFHYALARRMCDHFTNFIKTGDPNGEGYDGNTLPVWNRSASKNPADDEILFAE